VPFANATADAPTSPADEGRGHPAFTFLFGRETARKSRPRGVNHNRPRDTVTRPALTAAERIALSFSLFCHQRKNTDGSVILSGSSGIGGLREGGCNRLGHRREIVIQS
jgi:hypothetical protein